MVSELISKYIWLAQVISGAGGRGLSLEEITGKYERRFGAPYSRRTFNNHRAAVYEVFGIPIICDRSTNRYSIPYGEDAMDGDSSVKWLVDTFTVKNALDLGKERLSGRVSVEDAPSGEKFLSAIMMAMENGVEVEIEYAKYSSSSPETLHVRPYAVKEHERRWYLIGYCHERSMDGKRIRHDSDMKAWRVYGLDRIHSLRETSVGFTVPKDFDVDLCFASSYGTYLPKDGEKSVTVRIWANDKESNYLRDLPLHRSQKDEGPAKDGGRTFSFRLIPNENFIMDLCKMGPRIKVLEPAEVREMVARELREASKYYINDENYIQNRLDGISDSDNG